MNKVEKQLLAESPGSRSRRQLPPQFRNFVDMLKSVAKACGFSCREKGSNNPPFPKGIRLYEVSSGEVVAWIGINGDDPQVFRFGTGQYMINPEKAKSNGFDLFTDLTRDWRDYNPRGSRVIDLIKNDFFNMSVDGQLAFLTTHVKESLELAESIREK
jgi:hypothetical protein